MCARTHLQTTIKKYRIQILTQTNILHNARHTYPEVTLTHTHTTHSYSLLHTLRHTHTHTHIHHYTLNRRSPHPSIPSFWRRCPWGSGVDRCLSLGLWKHYFDDFCQSGACCQNDYVEDCQINVWKEERERERHEGMKFQKASPLSLKPSSRHYN
jgi:hypothetical protein